MFYYNMFIIFKNIEFLTSFMINDVNLQRFISEKQINF
jgi:hypothetical protein